MGWLALLGVSVYLILCKIALADLAKQKHSLYTPVGSSSVRPEHAALNCRRQLKEETPMDKTKYQEGRDAYFANKPQDACPYNKGEGRQAWFTGWFNARTLKQVGAVLARHGVGTIE